MKSCLYRGYVRHARKQPAHQFTYSTAWAYLDLDEAESIIDSSWLLGRRRFSPMAFRRADHLDASDTNDQDNTNDQESLADSVRRLIQTRTGLRIDGAIRILTQLRHFGIYFSPINVYYCFDESDQLRAMVAEVSNTPWHERHWYVLWDGNRVDGSRNRYAHPKEFHVSPFMGMDSTYQWRVAAPKDRCIVSLGCDRKGERIFQASLHLERMPLTDAALLKHLVRRPVAAAHLVGGIYFQALRLWIKRCQFFPHPGNSHQAIPLDERLNTRSSLPAKKPSTPPTESNLKVTQSR